MDQEISIKCPRCGETNFQFSVKLLELKGEVECRCSDCDGHVRIILSQDKIEIVAS